MLSVLYSYRQLAVELAHFYCSGNLFLKIPREYGTFLPVFVDVNGGDKVGHAGR